MDDNHNQANILDDEDEDMIHQSASKPGRRGNKKKGLLREDIQKMMIGFGEVNEGPRDDTVELMELFVIEFINNLARRSLTRSLRGGFNSIQLRDLLHVIEDDEKKFLRVPYLLTCIQNMDIKNIQRQMDPTSANNTNKGFPNV